VVSIGTSAPELVVSLLAAVGGSPDLATGNVLGSNLANIGLILGTAAILTPLVVARQVVVREVPWMLGVTLLLFPLLWDLRVGRFEGGVLSGALLLYLYFLFRVTRDDGGLPVPVPEDGLAETGYFRPIASVGAGTVGLVLGGRAIVRGATALASELGIPEVIVGLSVVAVGTSLPELATTVVAAARREADLAVGNVVGSNIFNLTLVLGATALVRPIQIDPRILRVEYPAVLLVSAVIVPLAWPRLRLTRVEGFLLLGLYAAAWAWILWARGV
jgi:cation:H+ antiporter